MKMTKILAVLLFVPCLSLLTQPARAREPFSVHALVGGQVVTAPGVEPVVATVVVREGVIDAVGAPEQIAVPPEARVWAVDGLTIYPGFVEACWEQEWPEEREPPPGAHDNPSVRPERQMARVAPEKDAVQALREAGFTTALMVPKAGVFRGQAALLQLADGSILEPRGPQVLAFETTRRQYPASLMGAVALIRQTFLDAAWYGQARAAYTRNPAQARPSYSAALETLHAAVTGGQPFFVVTEDALSSVRATRLARELRLPAVLVGNGQEYQWLTVLRQAQPERPFPVILPLNFPEAPDVGTEGAAPGISLGELRHWDQAPDNPRAVAAAGFPVAFTSHGLKKPADLFPAVVRAIDQGLSPADALAALTTEPARILGLENRAGTLRQGKAANLLLVEGALWVDRPVIREVWIEGRRFAVSEAEPAAGLKPADVAGAWQLEIAGGEPVILVLREPEGDAQDPLAGTLIANGIEVPLSAVTLDGRQLTLEYDGAAVGHPGTVTLNLEVEGDRLKGEGEGPGGTFPVTGERGPSLP